MARNTIAPFFNMSADVVITIRDTNDNPPEFSEPQYVVAVPEATLVRRPVATVVATDDDGGLAGTVCA